MNILYEYLFHLHQQISGWWTFGDIKIYSIYCASGSFVKIINIKIKQQTLNQSCLYL